MDGAEPRWMTYRELAGELGISLRAAEARAKRNIRAGRWRHRTDNEPPKAAQVLVPPADLEAMRGGTAGVPRPGTHRGTGRNTVGGTAPHNVHDLLAELKASHEQALGELRRRAEAAEDRERQRTAEAAELRERLGRAEGEAAARRDAEASERARADAERRGREEAERALAEWKAGGPLARAWRALVYR